jgi:hypothetical protein
MVTHGSFNQTTLRTQMKNCKFWQPKNWIKGKNLREADRNIENVLVSDGEIELRILIGLFVLFSH